MPLKSIYEIEIDDSKFKKFKELFDQYKSALSKLPKDWEKVASGVSETKSEFQSILEQVYAHNNQIKTQEDNTKKLNAVARTTAIIWSSITSSVQLVDKHISHITSSILKWSTISAAFTGILGAGTLFGIDRLAHSVAYNRRSSLGLGVTYGEQSAFNLNYSRLINPGSLLQNVSEAKYNFTSPNFTALLASGVSPKTIAQSDTAQISVQFLQNLPRLFAGMHDRGMIGAKAEALGITKLISMPDLIAYLNATPEEKKSIAEKYAQDAENLKLSEEAQQRWQNLSTQLSRAASKIEVSFAEKLARLAPGLEKLSELFTDIIVDFLKTDTVDKWITGLGDGIEKLADIIGTPEFEQGVEQFAQNMEDAAKKLWSFILGFKNIDSIQSLISKFGNAGIGGTEAVGPASLNWGATGVQPGLSAPPNAPSSPKQSQSVTAPPGAGLSSGVVPKGFPDTQAGHEAYIRLRASQLGIDPDFAVAVAKAEGLRALSEKNPNSASYVDRDPVTGQPFSFGDFQLNVKGGLGVLARHEGIDPANPNDWQRADDYALRYMTHDLSPWRGDMAVESYRNSGRLSQVIVRPNTGNNPVLAHMLASQPTTAVQQGQ